MMVILDCCTDVGSCQNRKHESLYKCNDQLDGHHKHGQGNADSCTRYGSAYALPYVTKNKDEADEDDNYDVACRDVGRWP